jgi:hypothetical protein
VLKKRSIIFIVSDFMDRGGEYQIRLRRLARRHDVIPVFINDKFEKRMPFFGLSEFMDLETGKVFLSQAVPKDREFFNLSGFDMIRLNTSGPTEMPLLRFFEKRKRERALR